MRTDLSQVLQNIAEDVLTLIYLMMDKEGLKSQLFRDDLSYTIEASDNPMISFLFDGYLAYIEDTKSTPTDIPTISELREWALKKGLPTDNATLQIIVKTINSMNIAPRPILAIIEDELNGAFDEKWSEMIFESIVKKIEYLLPD